MRSDCPQKMSFQFLMILVAHRQSVFSIAPKFFVFSDLIFGALHPPLNTPHFSPILHINKSQILIVLGLFLHFFNNVKELHKHEDGLVYIRKESG